jgi:hypothetical protein
MNSISIPAIFKEAYLLFKENANVCVIYFFLMIGALLISIIPFVGNLINMFLSGALNIGLAIYIHRKMNEGVGKTEFLFDVFKNNFLKMTCIQIIVMLIFISLISTILMSVIGAENIKILVDHSKNGMIDAKIVKPFEAQFMKAMGIILLVVSFIFPLLIFAPYFGYFKNQGILESLNNSIQYGVKNIIPILFIFISMILAILISTFACFTPLVFILPYFMIVLYLYFRHTVLYPVSNPS